MDEQPQQQTPPATEQTLEEKLAQLEAQAQEYLDGWKRAKADLINLKQRTAAEQDEFLKFSKREWLLSLLPILDNFGRAQKEIPPDHAQDSWVVGVGFIKKQLEKILQDQGAKEIPVEIGAVFDPMFHQAIGTVVAPDEEEGKIKEVVDAGYMLLDRVLRPAKVRISAKA